MKRIFTLLLNFILVISLLAPASAIAAPSLPPAPTQAPLTPQQQVVEQAILAEVKAHRTDTLYTLIYGVRVDHINIDPTLGLATAWVIPVDLTTGQDVPTEPAIVAARLGTDQQTWTVYLTTSPDYPSVIASLPDSMMLKEQRDVLSAPAAVTPQAAQAFSGYYLPWLGGSTKFLVGSIWHAVPGGYANPSCPNTCFYAFDFADGTMFPLIAAKSGNVWAYKDTTANNSVGTAPNYTDCDLYANYLIIKDNTTSPATYAVYYHLAQGTIPANLKQIGAYVSRGDFIGRADNTGCSSGSHLHFQVFTTPNSAHWGASVDITFNDVDINGGRPRKCAEASAYPQYGSQCHTGDYFTSGNRAPTPPTGTLTAPAAWAVITGSTLTVSGSGTDNTSVAALQVVADYNGTWTPLTAQFTSNPFTVNIDLCAAGIPDGPLTVGLYVWDNEDTRSLTAQSARPVVKNYSCQPPPPPCNPVLGQVALYTLPDYMGVCQVYSVSGGLNSAGIYNTASLGAVGSNTASSIKLGGGVMATLYDGDYSGGAFAGRAESFDSSDPGLGDNRIGVNHVSSLQVQPLAVPAAPTLNPPQSSSGAAPRAIDSVMLAWSGAGGGVDFQVVLTLPDGSKRTSPWLRSASWSLGSLAAGNYSWTVTARNAAGSNTSNPAAFSVSGASLSGSTVSFPYADNMSSGVNGWTTTGLWRQTTSSTSADPTNKFWAANKSSGGANPRDGSYASTAAPSELTSPPIAIPASGGAYLRFHEFFQTESSGPYWDQRLVQISVDGGPFSDVYQMLDDPQDAWNWPPYGYWIYSPFINLSAYAGKTVRVRFYFNPVDSTDNGYLGWFIDDVSLNATAPDVQYAETTPNNSAATATPIAMNSTTPRSYICPAGDEDFYSLPVNAGDIVNFNINAQSLGSKLDTYIYLIDSDGQSILAQNDDKISGVVVDSGLTHQFNRTGTYYLKVKSWSYPGSTSATFTCANYFYTLSIASSSFPPAISLTSPASNWIPGGTIPVSANVTVSASGVSAVSFVWHSPDWANTTWETLPAPTSPSAGVWTTSLNPTGRSLNGSVLVARVTDNTGLTTTTWQSNLQIDNTAPVSQMTGPTGTVQSTVFPITWTSADSGIGVRYTEIEYKDLTLGTGWQPWGATYANGINQTYFTGLAGHSYGFSVRGVDYFGNVESFSANPEITLAVASTCTPDDYEKTPPGDNSPATADPIQLGAKQVHNFCTPGGTGGDEDWLSFTAPAAGNYLVRVRPLGLGSQASAAVTSPDGLTVLNQAAPPSFGMGMDLKFTAPAPGSYKLRLTSPSTNLWGTSMQYSVQVVPGYWDYLPNVSH